MEREGQILLTARVITSCLKKPIYRGKVQGHRNGYGFLLPDDGSADLFLDQRQMGKVMHGAVCWRALSALIDGTPGG